MRAEKVTSVGDESDVARNDEKLANSGAYAD